MARLDIGKPTAGAAHLSDEALDDALRGANTGALDAAADKQTEDQLDAWADAIRRAMNRPESAQYAADAQPAQYDAGGTHWITIGGHEEGDEKHKGGSRVLIGGDGTIVGGNVPRSLQGKKIGEFKTLIDHHRAATKQGAAEKPTEDNHGGHAEPERPGEQRQPGDTGGGASPPSEAASAGGSMAAEAERPGNGEAGRQRPDAGKPAGQATARRVPASQAEVNRRLDRFEKLFRSRGQEQQANWMGMLRAHVEQVGTDAALAALGADAGKGDGAATQYEGGWDDMGHFAEAYLDRYGITPTFRLEDGPDAGTRTISSMSPSQGGTAAAGHAEDFVPSDPTLPNKLAEAKHLPGLEASEDLSVITGKPTTHLTPDVLAKLDEKYGAGKWIVKPYGELAFNSNGVFFPQRAAQIVQDARNTIWASGAHLAQYGFSHLRDKSGRVIGIKHANGDEYPFGSDKYNQTINGEVREWGDKAAQASASEQGAELPEGGKEFMAQPAFPVVGISDADRAAGMTIKQGQEGRVHVVTRNGKAEVVPHSTWLKGEWLPVVFESDDTRAMAQAAADAINALPESERQNQIYAPDIVKTAGGYKVVEANPANETGSSGYLGNSPFIIDAYVSHLTGREPAHVQFIRKLLTSKRKGHSDEQV